MKHSVLLLLTTVMLGCQPVAFGPGLQDFSAPLPHGYFIHRTSAHQIIVAPQQWSPDTPIIPTKVVELDHDDQFIIAKQQLLERRSPNNPNDTYEQPKPDAFQYWILDMQTPKVYGPFTEEEFDIERSGLAVPTELQLHDVYDYRP
ncbi:DUF3997 domain-containing protein [Rubripirellula amarantea]|nr:DUF3997 domain-containing protein [Rubripirellula amarantea]